MMRFSSFVSITHHTVPSNVLDLIRYIVTHCQSVFTLDDVTKHSTSISIEVDDLPDVSISHTFYE